MAKKDRSKIDSKINFSDDFSPDYSGYLNQSSTSQFNNTKPFEFEVDPFNSPTSALVVDPFSSNPASDPFSSNSTQDPFSSNSTPDPFNSSFDSSFNQPIEPVYTPEPIIEAPKSTPEPIIEAPKSTPEPIIEAPKSTPEPIIEKPKSTPEPIIEKPKSTFEPVYFPEQKSTMQISDDGDLTLLSIQQLKDKIKYFKENPGNNIDDKLLVFDKIGKYSDELLLKLRGPKK